MRSLSRPTRLSRVGDGPGCTGVAAGGHVWVWVVTEEAEGGSSARGRSWGLGGFPDVRSRLALWTHVATYLPRGPPHLLSVLPEQGFSKYLHELEQMYSISKENWILGGSYSLWGAVQGTVGGGAASLAAPTRCREHPSREDHGCPQTWRSVPCGGRTTPGKKHGMWTGEGLPLAEGRGWGQEQGRHALPRRHSASPTSLQAMGGRGAGRCPPAPAVMCAARLISGLVGVRRTEPLGEEGEMDAGPFWVPDG